MKIKDIDHAIAVFKESAIEHTQASHEGDYKRANKYFDKVNKSAKYLKDKDALVSLKELLEHEEKGVQIWASTYLLSICECVAKEKLKSIQEADLPHYSFTSKITLEEWENGNLELQYK